MKGLRIAAIAAAMMMAAPAAASEITDGDIMDMALVEWAGVHCGTLIPMDDYWRAMRFMQEKVDRKKVDWYRKRARALVDKAASRDAACTALHKEMEDIRAGK